MVYMCLYSRMHRHTRMRTHIHRHTHTTYVCTCVHTHTHVRVHQDKILEELFKSNENLCIVRETLEVVGLPLFLWFLELHLGGVVKQDLIT